jgi:Zinc knuckle
LTPQKQARSLCNLGTPVTKITSVSTPSQMSSGSSRALQHLTTPRTHSQHMEDPMTQQRVQHQAIAPQEDSPVMVWAGRHQHHPELQLTNNEFGPFPNPPANQRTTSIESEKRKSPLFGNCFNCNKPGHFRRDCSEHQGTQSFQQTRVEPRESLPEPSTQQNHHYSSQNGQDNLRVWEARAQQVQLEELQKQVQGALAQKEADKRLRYQQADSLERLNLEREEMLLRRQEHYDKLLQTTGRTPPLLSEEEDKELFRIQLTRIRAEWGDSPPTQESPNGHPQVLITPSQATYQKCNPIKNIRGHKPIYDSPNQSLTANGDRLTRRVNPQTTPASQESNPRGRGGYHMHSIYQQNFGIQTPSSGISTTPIETNSNPRIQFQNQQPINVIRQQDTDNTTCRERVSSNSRSHGGHSSEVSPPYGHHHSEHAQPNVHVPHHIPTRSALPNEMREMQDNLRQRFETVESTIQQGMADSTPYGRRDRSPSLGRSSYHQSEENSSSHYFTPQHPSSRDRTSRAERESGSRSRSTSNPFSSTEGFSSSTIRDTGTTLYTPSSRPNSSGRPSTPADMPEARVMLDDLYNQNVVLQNGIEQMRAQLGQHSYTTSTPQHPHVRFEESFTNIRRGPRDHVTSATRSQSPLSTTPQSAQRSPTLGDNSDRRTPSGGSSISTQGRYTQLSRDLYGDEPVPSHHSRTRDRGRSPGETYHNYRSSSRSERRPSRHRTPSSSRGPNGPPDDPNNDNGSYHHNEHRRRRHQQSSPGRGGGGPPEDPGDDSPNGSDESSGSEPPLDYHQFNERSSSRGSQAESGGNTSRINLFLKFAKNEPRFSGEHGQGLEFLREFKHLAAQASLTPSETFRIFRLRLQKTAVTWFDQSYPGHLKRNHTAEEVEELYSRFIRRFEGTSIRAAALAKIAARKHQPDESYAAYLFDILRYCDQVDENMCDETIAHYLESGLSVRDIQRLNHQYDNLTRKDIEAQLTRWDAGTQKANTIHAGRQAKQSKSDATPAVSATTDSTRPKAQSYSRPFWPNTRSVPNKTTTPPSASSAADDLARALARLAQAPKNPDSQSAQVHLAKLMSQMDSAENEEETEDPREDPNSDELEAMNTTDMNPLVLALNRDWEDRAGRPSVQTSRSQQPRSANPGNQQRVDRQNDPRQSTPNQNRPITQGTNLENYQQQMDKRFSELTDLMVKAISALAPGQSPVTQTQTYAQGQKDTKYGNCHNCDKPGHFRRECPEPQRPWQAGSSTTTPATPAVQASTETTQINSKN